MMYCINPVPAWLRYVQLHCVAERDFFYHLQDGEEEDWYVVYVYNQLVFRVQCEVSGRGPSLQLVQCMKVILSSHITLYQILFDLLPFPWA